jgi:hypothetical protein
MSPQFWRRALKKFIVRKHPENVRRTGEVYWARSVCSGLLRAGRSGGRIPVLARYSATVQTGHGANPVSFPGGSRPGRNVDETSPRSADVKENSVDISSDNDVRFHQKFRGCVQIPEKNSTTSDMTKMPLFILRIVPCGQTVTRSKVTNIRIKSVAYSSVYLSIYSRLHVSAVFAKPVAVNKIGENECVRATDPVRLFVICVYQRGCLTFSKNWHLL